MTARSSTILIGLGAVLVSAGAAFAAPAFHAGEWETRMDNGPARLVCETKDRVLDQAAVSKMMAIPGATCAPGDFHSVGPVTTFSLTCQLAGGGRLTSHSTITWNGPDAYTTHSQTHLEGGSVKMPDQDDTMVSHRLGPCKPSDRPSAR